MLNKNWTPAVYSLIILLSGIAVSGCSPTRIIREFHDPVQLDYSSVHNKSIKVHMMDGSLYILDSLFNSNNTDTVSGFGSYFNEYREIVSTNKNSEGRLIPPGFQIPLSGVALFETNNITGLKGKVLAMTLIGVPTAIISVYCIINPKACFGSCPTFYSWDGKDTVLMAEGFSSSILRSFEKEDIDMLYNAKPTGNIVNLKLTNEALETHVIRYADLLVFPRKQNERVFAVEDGYFASVSDIRSPSSCRAAEGDCLETVTQMDQRERFSETDAGNLAAKEYIELNFNSIPEGDLGLIIGSRQTFLTTFLFYQSLAYMGHSAGNFAADIESGDRSLEKKVNKVWDVLGDIEVSFQDRDGNWIKAGGFDEQGPIASDVHFIRLHTSGQTSLKVKLLMTKGLWRIDYLALGKIGTNIEPVRIKPYVANIETAYCGNNAKPIFSDTLQPLVTLPGDKYNLTYCLPTDSEDYELFLCSKGYYIEWMREPWLQEENLKKASLLFGFPRLFMRMAAKDFKLTESTMEDNFWKSRYVKKD
jgi:hypothetical protein